MKKVLDKIQGSPVALYIHTYIQEIFEDWRSNLGLPIFMTESGVTGY